MSNPQVQITWRTNPAGQPNLRVEFYQPPAMIPFDLTVDQVDRLIHILGLFSAHIHQYRGTVGQRVSLN